MPALPPAQPHPVPVQPAPGGTWLDRAACANWPHERGEPDPWYPTVSGGPTPASQTDSLLLYGVARKICAGCPVKDTCLDDAMENEGSRGAWTRYGMQGGLTPQQRAIIAARKYRKKAKGKAA